MDVKCPIKYKMSFVPKKIKISLNLDCPFLDVKIEKIQKKLINHPKEKFELINERSEGQTDKS